LNTFELSPPFVIVVFNFATCPIFIQNPKDFALAWAQSSRAAVAEPSVGPQVVANAQIPASQQVGKMNKKSQ